MTDSCLEQDTFVSQDLKTEIYKCPTTLLSDEHLFFGFRMPVFLLYLIREKEQRKRKKG